MKYKESWREQCIAVNSQQKLATAAMRNIWTNSDEKNTGDIGGN